MPLNKAYKLPKDYDPRILEQMFTELFSLASERFIPMISGAPTAGDGKDGDMRFDKTNNKLYIKNGTWKPFTSA